MNLRDKIRTARKLRATSLVEVLVALTIFATLIIYFLQLTSYALRRAVVLYYKQQQYNAAVTLGHIIYEVVFRDYADAGLSTVLNDGLIITYNGGKYEFGGVNTACNLVGARVSSACNDISVISNLNQINTRFGYYIDVTYVAPAYVIDITVACKEGQNTCDTRQFGPVQIRRYILK